MKQSRFVQKFKNPILSGFYPDPSICRVGGDFYLVTSTFAYFPGIPVFHSNDLIRWKQIGNAIDRPGQLNYDGHQISQGLFAPTIRENEGTFYILCTLIKNGGNFIITAKNPGGPWSDPIWLKGADGIDPSIFFDDDGKIWYCGTRAAPEGEAYSGNYEIYIYEIDAQLLSEGKNPLIGESIGIWRGALRDTIWPEGPHIYKINGSYFLLHAEGGTGFDHAVCIARAKDIKGSWEGKRSNPILTHRHLGKTADIINAGHADLFDDTEGNWRMVCLASRPIDGVCPLGRETFIVPIIWENGWPLVATKSGMIEEQISFKIEQKAENNEWKVENCCDHFNGKLPFHWLVLRMPVNEKDAAFSLTERKGVLRLFTRPETLREKKHCAFAGRRIRHFKWAFSALIDFKPKTTDESAGIVLLQSEDYQYRFEKYLTSDNKLSLKIVLVCGDSEKIIPAPLDFKLEDNPLVLAAICDNMAINFFYGKDQYSLTGFGKSYDPRYLSTEYAGGFVGSLAGVFATGNGKNTNNYADILWVEYRGLE